MSIVENHGVYVKEDNGDWHYKAGMMSTIHCAHHARFALSFSGALLDVYPLILYNGREAKAPKSTDLYPRERQAIYGRSRGTTTG